MELKIIKTKKDYHAALERFEEVFSAKTGTKESNEADILSLLIQDYENRHFVIEAPTPIEAIKYRMEQQGLSNRDLAKMLGNKSRVSDIFHSTRKLNLRMIRTLSEKLHISVETLVKEY